MFKIGLSIELKWRIEDDNFIFEMIGPRTDNIGKNQPGFFKKEIFSKYDQICGNKTYFSQGWLSPIQIYLWMDLL